jgi:hypothetical protein
MKVLVTATRGWLAEHVAADLTAAGDQVLFCHQPGASWFPCVGLQGGPCPLDLGVEVAVAIREHAARQPTGNESEMSCALRHDLPVVVAGRTALHPFEGFAAVVLDGLDGITEACARAIDASPPHSATRRSEPRPDAR